MSPGAAKPTLGEQRSVLSGIVRCSGRLRANRTSAVGRPVVPRADTAVTWTGTDDRNRGVLGAGDSAVALSIWSQWPVDADFWGIHGNERNSADLARRLAEHLMTHPEVYGETAGGAAAVANPDGTVKDSRTNSRGVDLNRNFPRRIGRQARKGHNSAASLPCPSRNPRPSPTLSRKLLRRGSLPFTPSLEGENAITTTAPPRDWRP